MAVDSFDLPPPSKRVINQQAGSMILTYFNFNKFHRVKDGVRRCKTVYGSVWGGTVAIECPGDCVHCRHLCSCCCGSPS